jgi:hypothetical protein
VIVPPRFDRYQEVSKTIMGVFASFSPEVETISLDEAFLDMTGSEQLFGDPEFIGRRLKEAVREATGGLTASVGLSGTKYVAKVASACQKPDGLTVVPPEDAKAWLAPLPVSGPRLKRAFTRSACKRSERWPTQTHSSFPQSLEGLTFTSMRSPRQKIPGRSSDGEPLRALGQSARSRRTYAGRRR